jgi:uncharacterized iron-regulated protein
VGVRSSFCSALGLWLLITVPATTLSGACLPAAEWVIPDPAGTRTEPADHVFARLARQQAVLLGETHSNPDHHRWQLGVLAGLHALRPKMILGFEMFPRRVQPVLDQWVAGTLTEAEFLTRSEWDRVWGFEPSLYMPIFQFARLHRIPMVALNVDRALVDRVNEVGWAAIPVSDREGVTDPHPATREYLAWLYPTFREHHSTGEDAGNGGGAPTDDQFADPAFGRFVEGMLLWDRAMAQAIAARLPGPAPPLAVGIIGSGHVRSGFGVPAQLKDLGIARVATALPWDEGAACTGPAAGLADAVYVLPPQAAAPETSRPRLGVAFEPGTDGMRVREVVPKSIAEAAGILAGDVIVQMAGEPVQSGADMVAAVQRQPPGSWLPIVVRRNGALVDLVARFPARP